MLRGFAVVSACALLSLAACADDAGPTPSTGGAAGMASAGVGGTAVTPQAGTTSSAGSAGMASGGSGNISGAPSGGTHAAGSGGAQLGGSGGAGSSPELDQACTPEFTLDMKDDGPNGQLFLDAVNDQPEAFVQDVGRTVCRILYRKADEVRAANHITLVIEDYDGVAAKWGDVGEIGVQISTRHLANVGKDRVADEVRGILLHEMTHMYQNDDKPEGTSPYLPNMYEGIGDFVRIRAGHPPDGAQPNDKSGDWYDKAYTSQAFFWLYVDTQQPDFVYQLNLSMKKDGVPWSESSIEQISGKSGDDWWTEYQGAACCKGSDTSCCK